MLNKYLTSLLGTLGIYASSCNNQITSEKNTNSIEPPTSKPSLEDVVTSSENSIINHRASLMGRSYVLSVQPVNAGQTSKIVVYDSRFYNRPKNDPITKIDLFENGNLIKSVDSRLLELEAFSKTESSNTYSAKLITKSGIEYITGELAVNFSGILTDFKPILDHFSATTNAGKASQLLINTKEIGDVQGIKEIRLYADGQLIQTSESHYLHTLLTSNSNHTVNYSVEIEAITGNITKSKSPISVHYSGEAFAPEISWINATQTEAGKATSVYFSANDKLNLDDNSGLIKAVLYENDLVLNEYNLQDLKSGHVAVEKLTYSEPGLRIYQVEYFNGNDKSTLSDKVEVNFTGEHLNPEIISLNARYDPETDVTSFTVFSNDKKNDHNDNGIRMVELYADNKLIKSFNNRDFGAFHLGGKKVNIEYKIVVTNTYGLSTSSIVNF